MNQTELAARDCRILTAFAAGRTLKEIALAEHVHPNTIRCTLRRYGINPSPHVRPVDATVVARLADRDWLAAEYATKNSLQIAAELGCSESRVRRALIRADIPRRQPHESPGGARGWRTWSADVQERTVARYCGGQSASAVAKELGVSLGGVYALLHERGVVGVRSTHDDERGAAAGREAAAMRSAGGRGQFTEDQERRVQRTIEQLRACQGDYASLHEELERKRLAWWEANRNQLQLPGSLVRQAYTIFLLDYLGLDAAEVPVVYEDHRRIVWRSVNFCSVLEGCRRLGLDTRVVCRAATERSVETLIRQLDVRLRFGRNYETGMRPHAAYCEEEIWLAE